MKIPKQITIGGHVYKIIFRDRSKEDGSDNPAALKISQHKIWMDTDQCQQEQEASLLHEIIEVLDYQLALKLEHDTITRLAGGIYQALYDNKLLKE